MSLSKLSFSDRISKVSSLLSVPKEKLIKSLSDSGINNDAIGLALLDADTTTTEDLVDLLKYLNESSSKFQLKACAALLKGVDPLSKSDRLVQYTSDSKPIHESMTVMGVVASLKPIQQWLDETLLEKYSLDRDLESETELNRRAKSQPFIVLNPGKHEPGKESINTQASLDLLKNARKRTNPTMLPIDGTVLQVYRITELNLNDRLVQICPVCGEFMYKAWCERCHLNLDGVGDDERAFMKLVADSGHLNVKSLMERKALLVSALKGIEDLRMTWPSIVPKFEELKSLGNLPKLKAVCNRPSTAATADPFFQNGNRTFGNRSY